MREKGKAGRKAHGNDSDCSIDLSMIRPLESPPAHSAPKNLMSSRNRSALAFLSGCHWPRSAFGKCSLGSNTVMDFGAQQLCASIPLLTVQNLEACAKVSAVSGSYFYGSIILILQFLLKE